MRRLTCTSSAASLFTLPTFPALLSLVALPALIARPAFVTAQSTANSATCPASPEVTFGETCTNIVRNAGACEWTGDCGMIDGTDCSNKCIASTDLVSSLVSSSVLKSARSSIIYCHLLATTINNAASVAASAPVAGGPAAGPAAAAAADTPTAGRRLQQAGPEGCPTAELVAEVAASAGFATLLQQGVTATFDGAEEEGFFGGLLTGELIAAFFELSCKTETLEAPLSGFFPPAIEPAAGECLGEEPLTPVTVCRDNYGLLEAVAEGLDSSVTISTRNELFAELSASLQSSCAAARSADAAAPCSPNAFLLDDACLQAIAPLYGVPILDSVPDQVVGLATRAFQSLQDECGERTSQEDCLVLSLPGATRTSSEALDRVLQDTAPEMEATTAAGPAGASAPTGGFVGESGVPNPDVQPDSGQIPTNGAQASSAASDGEAGGEQQQAQEQQGSDAAPAGMLCSVLAGVAALAAALVAA